MAISNLIFIGKISRTHGYKGDLVCRLSNYSASVVKPSLEFIFFEMDSEKVPFRLREFSMLTDDSLLINLANCEDDNEARKFINSDVFLQNSDIDIPRSTLIADENIIGWSVFNNSDFLGLVEDLIENKTQFLIVLTYKKKEVFIPLVEAFIIRIDEIGKSLYLSLPDGLLDL